MSKRIVLIDDDPINNLILKKELSKKDKSLEVIVFETADEAMSFYKSEVNPPNLILLDINMPEISGWEFLEFLEEKKINSTVFMITSSVVKRDKEKAENYPLIKEYLIKPLGSEDFDKIIKSIS
jgi:response regulator RpfG family c-di-GMP phosphodiesterase